MIGQVHDFMKHGLRLGLLCGAGMILTACVADPFKDAAIDPASPAAAAVSAELAKPGDYPTFESVPKRPTDLRKPEQYRRTVDEMEALAAEVNSSAGQSGTTVQDTESFADKTRKAAGPAASETSTTPSSEAAAEALRDRAKPPPSPR